VSELPVKELFIAQRTTPGPLPFLIDGPVFYNLVSDSGGTATLQALWMNVPRSCDNWFINADNTDATWSQLAEVATNQMPWHGFTVGQAAKYLGVGWYIYKILAVVELNPPVEHTVLLLSYTDPSPGNLARGPIAVVASKAQPMPLL